jgi:hypothetical protein
MRFQPQVAGHVSEAEVAVGGLHHGGAVDLADPYVAVGGGDVGVPGGLGHPDVAGPCLEPQPVGLVELDVAVGRRELRLAQTAPAAEVRRRGQRFQQGEPGGRLECGGETLGRRAGFLAACPGGDGELAAEMAGIGRKVHDATMTSQWRQYKRPRVMIAGIMPLNWCFDFQIDGVTVTQSALTTLATYPLPVRTK